ncbi:RNA polymerase sigma factor [Pyxidicoccus xibeiensis]|uniref:RNA polymerase sigma factor n=1 Tax=Pyxidicoccus xibeiensis TaxID=2906759 RepID=UPI0020A795A3|nr:sigma-70 family RNA polymerase sigma factor [Pyxidicoccus xibeiensis]MCP3139295.1 sigma-70 family RNA polymerase sigma factor [Pyxidicoccus xibeiensis]
MSSRSTAPPGAPTSQASPDAGDLAGLYRRFGPAVHRRALSLTRDAEEALDVTQDTFLAYMKSRDTPRAEASPFTLLYQIATYRAVDRVRRRARWYGRLGPLSVEDADGEAEQRGQDVASAHTGGLERVEALQDLALLTQGEDPEVLTVAVLYFVEGHTTEEVAQVLDLSRKTVSRMLARFAERAQKRSLRLSPGAAP